MIIKAKSQQREQMSISIGATIRKAWGLIDTPNRWCKGVPSIKEADGTTVARCGLVALLDAADGEFVGEAFDALARTAELAGGLLAGGREVPSYNDHPSTTHDDMRRLFMAGAEVGDVMDAEAMRRSSTMEAV